MMKEEKQILLKDLCARLPYGFTVHRYSDNRNITFEKNELDEFSHFLEYSEGKEFKPYLRPLSSMTEEEDKELSQMIEIELNYLASNEEGHTVKSAASSAFEIDFYNRHHFDYRGLIEMGLALEAPEGLYKN